ncbi:MAG: EAL domain-containing protein [Kangiellaceae bacterium]|nr:EAL domain-containing protein [Kangiellaceae bacterium]
MRLKNKLTLIYVPLIVVIALVQVATVAIYLNWSSSSTSQKFAQFVTSNWQQLTLFFIVFTSLNLVIWFFYRLRIERQLILKLEYLNQFIRDFGKANPLPIDGLIPETDEIDRLVESVLVMRNNYAIKKKSLEKLAYYDKLTGLPNIDFLIKELARVMSIASRRSEQIAILHLDLEGFREINDHLGKEFGDELLTAVGHRLEKLVRAGDMIERKSINDSLDNIVARIVGVEFTLLLVDIEQSRSAYTVAQRILDGLEEPFILHGHSVHLEGNIGISLYPDDATKSEALLKNADFALNEAKKQGTRNIEYFTKEMNMHAQRKAEFEKSIRAALEEEELILHFQPRVALENGQIVACEALVRWQRPEYGLVPASEFMKVAEETNLICEIGNWVFDKVCFQMRKWRNAGYTDLKVSINISAGQLYSNDTFELIQNYIKLYDIPGDHLEIEVNESAIIKDESKAIFQLSRLKQLGIKISLDDFGNNYSSLKLLQALPLDVIKIDRQFINREINSTGGKKLLKSIIEISKCFDIHTVACGIEEQFQVDFFKQVECEFIQGFYFSSPLNSEHVCDFIENWVFDLGAEQASN